MGPAAGAGAGAGAVSWSSSSSSSSWSSWCGSGGRGLETDFPLVRVKNRFKPETGFSGVGSWPWYSYHSLGMTSLYGTVMPAGVLLVDLDVEADLEPALEVDLEFPAAPHLPRRQARGRAVEGSRLIRRRARRRQRVFRGLGLGLVAPRPRAEVGLVAILELFVAAGAAAQTDSAAHGWRDCGPGYAVARPVRVRVVVRLGRPASLLSLSSRSPDGGGGSGGGGWEVSFAVRTPLPVDSPIVGSLSPTAEAAEQLSGVEVGAG